VASIVIADASPLIALARVNGLGWLQQLFTEVVVTDVVLSDVLTGRYPDTESPIQQALAAGWLQGRTGLGILGQASQGLGRLASLIRVEGSIS
jgi:hypothetical protein